MVLLLAKEQDVALSIFNLLLESKVYENTNNILTFYKLNLDRNCIKYTIALGILVIMNVHPI